MSLIIAVNDGQNIYMAADKGVYDNQQQTKVIDKHSKMTHIVNKVQGDVVLGAVGSNIWCDIVYEAYYNFFKNEPNFLITRWKIRKQMQDIMDEYADVETESTSEMMILTKESIIVIDSQGGIVEPDKFYWAIGAGADYAMGYFDATTYQSLSPRKPYLAEKIISSCARYSTFVMEEYDIIILKETN